ncbi:hypothetical protein CE91St40_19830 [Oscillospiraceae bacterium]|nr:hypothetical protein CE91St40_19830 [Oscillospiraceae bacterium]
MSTSFSGAAAATAPGQKAGTKSIKTIHAPMRRSCFFIEIALSFYGGPYRRKFPILILCVHIAKFILAEESV